MPFYIYVDGNYFLGKTYTHHGERFPCTTNRRHEAKEYKTKKIAEGVAKKLNEKCDNVIYVIES